MDELETRCSSVFDATTTRSDASPTSSALNIDYGTTHSVVAFLGSFSSLNDVGVKLTLTDGSTVFVSSNDPAGLREEASRPFAASER